MTVELAIRTAIEYETQVRDLYAAAKAEAREPAGARFLEVLADEEQRHVDYLDSRLAEWSRTGKVAVEAIATAVPSKERIAEGVKSLKDHLKLSPDERDAALAILKRALDVEVRTSAFYQEMVATLPEGEPRRMFARFLEIEDGHVAIVAAEIDSVNGLGFWFDVREFELEAG